MKSTNFEFLRPSFPELADLVVVAECYTFSDPASALIKLRMFAETAKCDRMSMGIGSDVDESVLSAFIAGTPHPLYRAANAGQLHEFFPPRDNVGRHEGIFQNPERDSRRDQLNRCGRSLCGRKTQFAISTTIRIGKRGGLLVRK